MKSFFLQWSIYFNKFWHYLLALLIFLIGIGFSLAAFYFYNRQDLERTRADFDRLADIRLYFIKDELLGTLEQLDFIEQFYYASDDITKDDFHIFVHRSFNYYPQLLFFGWWQETPAPPLSQSSYLDFSYKNGLALNDGNKLLLTYLELAHPKLKLTFNETDYPSVLDALEKDSSQSLTVISSAISYQEANQSKLGFFLFKPIFYGKMEHPIQDNGVFGKIVSFASFEDFIENIKNKEEHLGINIQFYDVNDFYERLLYETGPPILKSFSSFFFQKQTPQQWVRDYVFEFGNRTWKLKASPTLEFIETHIHWGHWEVPLIGILISSLMASYFLALVNRRIRIEQEVKERTNQLATINSQLQQEIQERQRIEENFTRTQKNLQRRHEALEYLTKLTTSEIRSAIHEVILRTATVMQVDRISVWFYETKGQTQILSCTGLYILSTNSFSNHLEFTSAYFPRYFEALCKQSHLILPSSHDAELNQELASYFAVFHITSKLDIPIVFEGSLLGVLSCEETRGSRHWILEDRHFGQSIADIIAIMIEQSARQKAEKALQESEERLRFLTQKAIDGIISVNDKEEIVSWNFGAEKMFGYQENEMLGTALQRVIPQDGFFLEEVSTKPIELKGQHKDGHLFPVEISHTRWKKENEHFDTIIVRDITERKENEKKLIKAIREARAANEAKNEFLATISHELRTPLNAIIGFNECVLMGMDGPINSDQQISLKKIQKSSFHLLNLINDILDLAKIEAKKMDLEILPYNLVDLVLSCIEEMQPLATQKNLDLSVSIEKPFILVEMDKVRIRQVLLNLLSNAIKFTEKGSIKVSIFYHMNQISVRVTDSGIGLSSQELSKIFQPFSQADSSITRRYGGTGLGLVISKKIIDLHQGTIQVESQKGLGSSFTFTIPISQTL